MKLTAVFLVVSMLFAMSAFAAVVSPRLVSAAGHVTSIDSTKNSLVAKIESPKGDSEDMTFVVANDSKIVKNGAAITLADLKQGDKITVTYKSEAGKNVIVNIGVESKM